jgi:hypothetical protein
MTKMMELICSIDHRMIQSTSKILLMKILLDTLQKIEVAKDTNVQSDVGATLEYLQMMQHNNPPFYYAVNSDEDGNFTNFFWADSRSIMDFDHFGDVVCLDSGYALQGYGRPLALFTGLNHHKQTVIFGAALLYDESNEAFR